MNALARIEQLLPLKSMTLDEMPALSQSHVVVGTHRSTLFNFFLVPAGTFLCVVIVYARHTPCSGPLARAACLEMRLCTREITAKDGLHSHSLWLPPQLHYFSSHHAPSACSLFSFLHRQFQSPQNSKASGAAAAFHLLSRRLDLRVFFNTRSIPLNLKLSAAAGLSAPSFKQHTLFERYRSDFLRQPTSSKCNSPLLPLPPFWPSLPALLLSPSHTAWLSCPA